MKILIDAHGGDNSPLEPILGASMAAEKFDCTVCLVGNIRTIKQVARKNGINLNGIKLYHAADAVRMDDPPLSVRSKPNSSLRVGFDLLKKNEVDAFISAGNTGAVHTGASLYVGRCKNLRRAAISTILPLSNPVLLIDAGANATPAPEHLAHFAIMGSVYMNCNFGIENPRVGLLNIGSEEHKGCELHQKTYKILSSLEGINFIGNVEANTVTLDVCDVLVSDGFSGNILLKSIEGTSKLLLNSISGIYKSNAFTIISYLAVKGHFKSFKKRFSASTYGGSPLLGISRPIIKAHGSANALTIFNAVSQASRMVENNIIEKIENRCDEFTNH